MARSLNYLPVAFGVGLIALTISCSEHETLTEPSVHQPAVAVPKVPPPSIDPKNFVSKIDNRFLPLTPGTTFYYKGESGGIPTRDVFFVTHQTKQILGVQCIEVHDQAYEKEVLAEDTSDWFAQDKRGNVWYFGEATRQLDEHGNVISTEGSWLAGVDGALPGIVMLADPERGDRYRQENAPGVAEDMARVLSLHESASVPYGAFDNLLLTEERTPLDRSSVERKFYAKDIGFLLGVTTRGGNDVTQLVNITTGG